MLRTAPRLQLKNAHHTKELLLNRRSTLLAGTYFALMGCLGGCQGWVKASGPEPSLAPAHGVLDCPTPLSIRPFRDDESFGTEWSLAVDRLVFNKASADGYQNLVTSRPDGSDERPLTFGNPRVPGKHACSPVWTPAGDYVVFSAEKKAHGGSSKDAMCGFGGYSDIWVISSDGSRAWPITDVPTNYDHGAMIPRLSRDGTQLLWTERIGAPHILFTAEAFGAWIMKVASFRMTDQGPLVTDVRSFQPGRRGFYEGADFTPDGRGILFTSSMATGNAWRSQIFRLDLESAAITKLTTDDYNEHPRYTPDGNAIVYMSSTGATLKGTDWWWMLPDGTGKRRITWFEDPKNPQSSGTALYPGTVAWDPSGRWFLGDIETNLLTQSYTRVKVTCP